MSQAPTPAALSTEELLALADQLRQAEAGAPRLFVQMALRAKRQDVQREIDARVRASRLSVDTGAVWSAHDTPF